MKDIFELEYAVCSSTLVLLNAQKGIYNLKNTWQVALLSQSLTEYFISRNAAQLLHSL